VKVEGSGSLRFDIVPSAGTASVSFPFNQNVQQWFVSSGEIKLSVWLASANISAVNLYLMTDSGNYYSISATTLDDGTPFAAGAWYSVRFLLSLASIVGSPNSQQINTIKVEIVEGAGFTTTDDFRIDNMRTIFPDYLDLIYLTSTKGTDKTGVTPKTFLDQIDDIPAFANFVPDVLEAVALHATVYLVPSIMSNAEFRTMYKNDSEEIMKIYGRSWPRKRIMTQGRALLRRPR
jgi:hypothetical protein